MHGTRREGVVFIWALGRMDSSVVKLAMAALDLEPCHVS